VRPRGARVGDRRAQPFALGLVGLVEGRGRRVNPVHRHLPSILVLLAVDTGQRRPGGGQLALGGYGVRQALGVALVEAEQRGLRRRLLGASHRQGGDDRETGDDGAQSDLAYPARQGHHNAHPQACAGNRDQAAGRSPPSAVGSPGIAGTLVIHVAIAGVDDSALSRPATPCDGRSAQGRGPWTSTACWKVGRSVQWVGGWVIRCGGRRRGTTGRRRAPRRRRRAGRGRAGRRPGCEARARASGEAGCGRHPACRRPVDLREPALHPAAQKSAQVLVDVPVPEPLPEPPGGWKRSSL
jgi:hypothetical protein